MNIKNFFKNKYTKKVIIILLAIILLFEIGIFTPTKSFYINYLKRNKSELEAIINFLSQEENDNIDLSIYSYTDIGNNKISMLFLEMYFLGLFERISENDGAVYFATKNIFLNKYESHLIVYSKKPVYNEAYGDDDGVTDFEIAYVEIEKNWYYGYRKH